MDVINRINYAWNQQNTKYMKYIFKPVMKSTAEYPYMLSMRSYVT